MYVLDTNTISYFFRGVPGVVSQMLARAPAELGVPAIVEYELRYGLMRLAADAAAPRLAALERLLQPMQRLPFDADCAREAATLRATLEAAGRPIGPHDTLIAATALAHRAVLVTHDLAEFARVPGLTCADWHQPGEP